MDKLLREYREMFDENFPIYRMMGRDDAEIIKIIKKCIEDGKPYEMPDADDEVKY